MRGIVLELSPRNERGDRQMLQGSEKILELLDDQLVAAGCMLRSPFAKALEGSVRAWRDKLNMLLHLLEGLLSFQKWFEVSFVPTNVTSSDLFKFIVLSFTFLSHRLPFGC